MSYTLGKRSLQNLSGVHPDLVAVVKRAIEITEQDFSVIEGIRNINRQRELVKAGFSKTLNSRHITGHAVDIVPWPIPSDWKNYEDWQWDAVASAMLKAAEELEVDLEWGYQKWGWDKPHYQLSRKAYP